MARGYLPLLIFVAAIWGASYMFISVAVDEIDPIPLMALRLFLASLVLLPILMIQQGPAARSPTSAPPAGGSSCSASSTRRSRSR